MMGALYYDKQPINIINEMGYKELKYWYGWHKIIQKTYSDISKDKGKK